MKVLNVNNIRLLADGNSCGFLSGSRQLKRLSHERGATRVNRNFDVMVFAQEMKAIHLLKRTHLVETSKAPSSPVFDEAPLSMGRSYLALL